MSKQQARLWEYREAVSTWKQDLTAELDNVDQVIFQLAEGDPEKIADYRWNYTHTALIEGYISKIINR